MHATTDRWLGSQSKKMADHRAVFRFQKTNFTFPLAGMLSVAMMVPLLLSPLEARAGSYSPRSRAWADALRGAAEAARGNFQGAARYFRESLDRIDSTAIRAAIYLARPNRQNLSKFEELARTRGTDGAIHYWAARLFLCSNPAKACRILEAAANLAPRSAKVLLAQGLACRSRNPRDARRALHNLISITWDILDPRLYPDRISGILELVTKALSDYPEQPRLLVTMAHLHLTAGHLREAKELARKVLALRPNHPEALFVLARASYRAGWHKKAGEYLHRLLSQRPSDPQALALQAALDMEKKQNAQALASLEASIRADPTDPVTLSRLGKLLWDRGNLARAEKMFRYALARMPDFAPAHYGLALALVHRKRPTEARDHFLAAISASPNDPVYRKGYAFFLQQRGKTALARKEDALAEALTRALRRIQKKTKRLRDYRLALLKSAQQMSRTRARPGDPASRRSVEKTLIPLPAGPASVRRVFLGHFHRGLISSAAASLARLSIKKLLCRSRPVNELTMTLPVSKGPPLTVLVRLDFADPRLF